MRFLAAQPNGDLVCRLDTSVGGLHLFRFPVLSIIISIVSMVGSLGATLSGVTFPVPSMYAPVHYASYLFPVRHFTEIYQNLLYGDLRALLGLG